MAKIRPIPSDYQQNHYPMGSDRGDEEEELINTELRILKREGGLFSIAKRHDIERLMKNKSLCGRCGMLNECSARKEVKELNARISEQGVVAAPILSCKIFQMPVYFKDLIGTDNVEFNTFRHGVSWVNRVRQEETVALTDTRGKKFGEGYIRNVRLLNRETAISRYSHQNHYLIDKGLPPAKAATQMRKNIVNMYGAYIAAKHAKICVIELTRTK